MFRIEYATRYLAYQLAKRDIKALYRQSILGVFWAFLLPIVNTITWVFLNGSGIVKVETGDIPYPVYVFTGTMMWQILTEAITTPIQVSVQAKSLFAKINFPHETIIISGFLQVLFNAVIKLVILCIALVFLGVSPDINILLLPFITLILIIFGLMGGVIMAPLGILYTDISKGIPLLMQLMMYLTPVVFMVPESGWGHYIYRWNPITPIISTIRSVITGTEIEYLNYFLIVSGIVMVLFFVSIKFYKKAIPILIERMSS